MLGNLTAFCRLSRVSVWAIHGEMDMISPAEYSQEYVDALSECPGAQIDWTVYPGICGRNGQHGPLLIKGFSGVPAEVLQPGTGILV